MVRAIPEGYGTLTPYLVVKGAHEFLAFLEKGFGAEVRAKALRPDGSVGNAEVRVGSSMLMTSEARPGDAPRPAMLYLYVEDADAWHRRAVAAGAKSVMEPADMFYGDRSGAVDDAWGNQWWMATHVEDVSPEELDRRMEAMKAPART